ncbi:TrbC/VirB2 family protein [Ruegeria sp. YS9]|jgi:type IV secretion system protein VirB2|uniref:TrbC/VirB2 family protein n=1 Tax=Ruegeria sp. YS9 TaxID=2966453 RepID=UPI00214AF55B|nr:TrbC/VirB2 family protein [Ruegeria sp. YS9]UUV08692.1 TrbC/VirB2 family protein [Ruegeria sp. YS9]
MKPTTTNLVTLCGVLLMLAQPALAQSIDLSPVQTLLQGIVDAITGPLGIVIGTLALIGVFLSWLFGILDFRQALWVVVAIAGIAAAPTIVAAIWTT